MCLWIISSDPIWNNLVMAFLSPPFNVIFLSSVIQTKGTLFEPQKDSNNRIASTKCQALAGEFEKDKSFDHHNSPATQLLKSLFYRQEDWVLQTWFLAQGHTVRKCKSQSHLLWFCLCHHSVSQRLSHLPQAKASKAGEQAFTWPKPLSTFPLNACIHLWNIPKMRNWGEARDSGESEVGCGVMERGECF